MKIVIIEDEKITAKDLKNTLLSIDAKAEIAALLTSVEEGIAYFKNNSDADLIFSDIQLGDGLSFDIFKTISNPAPIVFCTAYNTYFSDAFEASGIDYILKPFTKTSVEKALMKFHSLKKKFTQNNDDYNAILRLLEAKFAAKKMSVIIHHRDKIIPLEAAAIAVLYIDNGCTFAYTFGGEKHLINDNLEELELAFAPQFFRANRQYLVNRKAVRDAAHFFNRKVIINLTIPFKEQILVGKLKATAFVAWLSQQ